MLDNNTTTLYHGSPTLINDRFMSSETYFTDDLEVAKWYGKFVYSVELTAEQMTIMQKDCFDEHYISTRLIPLYLFTITEF